MGTGRIQLADNAEKLRQSRENTRLLPGVRIPDSVEITASEAEAVASADCWVTAIPTAYLRATLSRFVGLLKGDAPVVSLTKGLEISTFRRPTILR